MVIWILSGDKLSHGNLVHSFYRKNLGSSNAIWELLVFFYMLTLQFLEGKVYGNPDFIRR